MAGEVRGRKLKTLETAFELLDVFERRGDATAATVAAELGLATSTVHGYLATLEEGGYLHREGSTYRLGARLLTLGGCVRHRSPNHRLVIDKVPAVAAETGERAQFIVEERGRGVTLHVSTGPMAVRTDARIGKVSHLHASAAGKVILALGDGVDAPTVAERWGLPGFTERTLTTESALEAELREIRRRGVATNVQESIPGLNAVGVPVSDGEDLLGALSVSGPSHRLVGETLESDLPNYLLGVANDLELRMSYGDHP